MQKSKIEWCDMTWNPVTGCFHGCPYCYARGISNRFGGHMDVDRFVDHPEDGTKKLHVLDEPLVYYSPDPHKAPFPFGFDPTLHRYRLDEPERIKKPQTVFVCSMSDLFGRWVPLSWIRDVLDACQRAPQHRYIFLTKNPARYLELDHLAMLPHGEKYWYGSTVTSTDTAAMYPMPWADINAFWSVEPLLEPVPMADAEGLPQWVILGAETGNRKDKVIPRREWVDQITAFCVENEIPVFYKDNLRKYFPDLPASAFPWKE